MMHFWLVCLLILSFSATSLTPLAAQTSATRAESLRIDATRRSADLRLDGRLDDEDWARATPIRGFVTSEPVEGMTPGEDTEVRVLFDEGAVYIGARMYDRRPETIFRQLTRRGDHGRAADYFEVSLDSNRDRRTGYMFRVSPAGVQDDAYRYDDTRIDRSWDGVWESAASIDADGWTAEIRIPLSQLRFEPTDDPQSWGVNFARRRNSANEKSFWSLESAAQHGGVSVHGTLSGLVLPSAPRALELRPYTLARQHMAPTEPGNPFFNGSSTGFSAGGDIRYGLGSTFVLEVALNPDFGQVEVDPAVINLSAFETFFPEQRPFFSGDDRIFDFGLSGGSNRLFYSRRVGRAPQGRAPAGAAFVDMPGETTILGAAKVTGRTAGGLTLGALAARTEAEHGQALLADGSTFSRFPAEPGSTYAVLRAQQDVRDGSSVIGGIVTMVRRDLPADGTFDWLASEAYSAGVNFEHSWANRGWALSGFLAGSHIVGEPEAMIRVQRSPNHYYQRPDALNLSVDSTRTSMSGAEWRLEMERRSGRHWTGAIWAAQRTPGFEVDDGGFGLASERLDGGARINYQQLRPGRLLLNYRLGAFTVHNWRHEALDRPFSWSQWWDRAHKAGVFITNSNFTFVNNWGLNASVGYSPRLFSDSGTRGGPLMVRPQTWSFNVAMNNDRRSNFYVRPGVNFSRGPEGNSSLNTSVSFSMRPTSATEIEIQPSYEKQRDPAQYVTAVADPSYLPTFGARYVFAELDRRTLSLPTRLNLIFSPTLSLQLFAQPLLSSGDFLSYRQLTRSESYDFDRLDEGIAVGTGSALRCEGGRSCAARGRRYLDLTGDGRTDVSFADRDFNIRSLRGNAVARWEYRPGSTLFVVWQQSRRENLNDGSFQFSRDSRALFQAPAQNTLIVKLTYWLGL
jgi:hypothetical protein